MAVTSKSPESTSSAPAAGGIVAFVRRPRVLAVLLISATVLLGSVVVVTRAAAIEAEARAELTSELNDVTGDLARVNARAVTARTLEAEAQECIDAEAARLQPALAASAHFSTPTLALAGAATARATEPGTPAPIVASGELILSPVPPEADADRAQLEAALVQAQEIRADAGASAHRAQLAAAERHAACMAAHDAVAAVLAEVGPRTDAVIAANGMATPESIAEMRAARDAVLAGGDHGSGADELPRWLAATAAVESTHAVANLAAIEAAERAAAEREAADNTSGSGVSWSGGLYRPGETTMIEVIEAPPVDWCAIEPDLIAYWDPVTGEPVPACY